MTRLAGLNAVVTGSGHGIGRAIAERLAADGASVMVADKRDDDFAEIQAGLTQRGAPRVASYRGDLSREDSVQGLFEASIAAFGAIDILVNNAGGGVIRPFLEHTPETLRDTIDRNLWTTLWCCRAFLPHMLERRFGRIVNISADSVHTGTYSHAGYNAAKGGVNGLTTGLAFEFGRHGITVNAVSPGGVMTPITERLMAHDSATEAEAKLTVDPRVIMETIPIRRFARMDEVAALVAFLAGGEAAAINGQVYSINGGQWMM